jgi:hypothetical protein
MIVRPDESRDRSADDRHHLLLLMARDLRP